MAAHGYRISWAGQSSKDGDFANVIQIIENICTPFAIHQFHLLGLLPPMDTHPRVLDNACGSGRQVQVLHDAYKAAGQPIDITCCDISPAMIEGVQTRIKKGNWTNVDAHIINAEVARRFQRQVFDGRKSISLPTHLRMHTCPSASCSQTTRRKSSRKCRPHSFLARP